jgi:hypothetical protein
MRLEWFFRFQSGSLEGIQGDLFGRSLGCMQYISFGCLKSVRRSFLVTLQANHLTKQEGTGHKVQQGCG